MKVSDVLEKAKKLALWKGNLNYGEKSMTLDTAREGKNWNVSDTVKTVIQVGDSRRGISRDC